MLHFRRQSHPVSPEAQLAAAQKKHTELLDDFTKRSVAENSGRALVLVSTMPSRAQQKEYTFDGGFYREGFSDAAFEYGRTLKDQICKERWGGGVMVRELTPKSFYNALKDREVPSLYLLAPGGYGFVYTGTGKVITSYDAINAATHLKRGRVTHFLTSAVAEVPETPVDFGSLITQSPDLASTEVGHVIPPITPKAYDLLRSNYAEATLD